MEKLERSNYGFGKTLAMPFPEALEQTKAALKEQGFGILSEIDLKQTMKEKRGIDFRNYVILGACNPPLAEQALAAELEIGLLLPCNVIVYEQDGESVVKAVDPEAAMGKVNNKGLEAVAREASLRLQKALAALPAHKPTGRSS